MNADRVMIWKFDSAPEELRRLHNGHESPEWLVLFPRSIYCTDVEEAMLRQTGQAAILRYETVTGDIIYTGSSPLNRLLEIVVSSGLPKGPADTD